MTQEDKSHNASHSVIVVGVDFSEASAGALREAAALVARAAVAELHIVHVLAGSPSPSLDMGGASQSAYVDELAAKNKTQDEWLAPLHVGNARVARHSRVGRADREIAQVASDVGADLIVVGATGHEGAARGLLGSVAESLVRSAPCAVLVYRPRTMPVWELIEPPCIDCLAARQVSGRVTLWCERHSQHHLRAHTYHETQAPTYGMGSQTFRS